MPDGLNLRVVGAGVGRTGTMSLKAALERLLDGPCYHMKDVEPEHMPLWQEAAGSSAPDLTPMLAGCTAAVDFPAAGFWRELADANPDAIVLLSTRHSAAAWWQSASRTIIARMDQDDISAEFRSMWETFAAARFTRRWREPGPAMAAYERHNAAVRAAVPADRLVEWQPGDGWGPLCAALGLAVPDEPFPQVNSSADFRGRVGLDGAPAA
jgi:hypothetical protein